MLLCYDTTICSRYDLPYPSIQYQYCTLQDVMHGKPNLTFFCSLTNCAANVFAVAIIQIFMTPDHKNSERLLMFTSAGNYNIHNGRYEAFFFCLVMCDVIMMMMIWTVNAVGFDTFSMH